MDTSFVLVNKSLASEVRVLKCYAQHTAADEAETLPIMPTDSVRETI